MKIQRIRLGLAFICCFAVLSSVIGNNNNSQAGNLRSERGNLDKDIHVDRFLNNGHGKGGKGGKGGKSGKSGKGGLSSVIGNNNNSQAGNLRSERGNLDKDIHVDRFLNNGHGKGGKGGKGGKSGKGGKGSKSSKHPKSKSSKHPKATKGEGKGKGKGGLKAKSSKLPKAHGGKGKGAKSSKLPGGKGKGGKGKGAKSSKYPKVGKKSSKYPKSKSSKKSYGTDAPTPVQQTPSPEITTIPTPAPTITPTPKTTGVCPGLTEQERNEGISSILETMTAVNVLADVNSPQYKAAQWLVNEDTFAACPENLARLVQRYALAAFYYSTGGDDWNFCSASDENCSRAFLGGGDECTWYGVNCNQFQKVKELKLEPLDGEDIGLNGILPPEIFFMKNLKDLELEYFNIDDRLRGDLSGVIPDSIGESVNLRALDLQKQEITGNIPDSLYNTTLREIDLDKNKLTGTISEKIGNLKNLIFFTASDNNFDKQELPATIGNIENLQYFGLNNANLEGPVPASFRNLAGMISLDLSDNKLEGDITFVEPYKNLQTLALDNNKFTGEIPAAIWSMNPFVLNLQDNKFEGRLPSIIPGLKNIRTLRLKGNDFTGPIPSVLASLTKLETLTLEGNNFTGEVPAALCDLPNIEVITIPKGLACPEDCCEEK